MSFTIQYENFKIQIELLNKNKEENEQPKSNINKIIRERIERDNGGLKETDDLEPQKIEKVDNRGKSIGVLHQKVKEYLSLHPNEKYRDVMKTLGEQMRNK